MNPLLILVWSKRLLKQLFGSDNHVHDFKLKHTTEEVWAECECGAQKDIPDELVAEAISQIHNKNLNWKY